MNIITRALVLPLLTAGIIGGALGFAGTATAAVTATHTSGSHSIVATPTTKPHPGFGNRHERRADRLAQVGR